MQILRQPRFIDDLSDAYAYLANRSPASGERLFDELDALLELLEVFPEAGRRRHELGIGIRSFRLRGFSLIVFYRIEPDTLTLLRLLHGAQALGEAEY